MVAGRVLQASSLQECLWSSCCKTIRGGGEMEDVLEEMWKKLSFTEEEDESITLGRGTIEAAKVVWKKLSFDEGSIT